MASKNIGTDSEMFFPNLYLDVSSPDLYFESLCASSIITMSQPALIQPRNTSLLCHSRIVFTLSLSPSLIFFGFKKSIEVITWSKFFQTFVS